MASVRLMRIVVIVSCAESPFVMKSVCSCILTLMGSLRKTQGRHMMDVQGESLLCMNLYKAESIFMLITIIFYFHQIRYVERNKEDGSPFVETVPAEIIYCEDLEAWVFRHTSIRTSLDELEEVSTTCAQ